MTVSVPSSSGTVIAFSAVALLISYGIFRLQKYLPFNPEHLPGVESDTAWNTAVSFVTNTNWQSYAGETTMSHLSQMGALAVQNFLSAAVGLAVAVALVRGFARRKSGTLGNVWVDVVRGVGRLLLPGAFVFAIVLVAGGVIPPQDYAMLRAAGVQAIFGPGTNLADAADEVLRLLGHNRPPLDEAAE